MADVANVTHGRPPTGVGNEPAAERPVELGVPPAQQRTWSMPKPPVNRKQADKVGRMALEALTNIARGVAGVARFAAHLITQGWRAVQAVPTALQLFIVAGITMLVGVVGAIAMGNIVGLLCTVVVVPVCSIILGALGHRWYTGLGNQRPQHTDTPAAGEQQRFVEYVDKKLAAALTSLGTEHHQQAVIALFQAKTAVELTLGTEQDSATLGQVPPADSQVPGPRIRLGSASKSLLGESNSLAAS